MMSFQLRVMSVPLLFFSELSEVCGEMGEFTFIHTLTGWIPEFRPVK